MKLFKRTQNCLFIEEEQYNWAPPKTSVNKKLLWLMIAATAVGTLFSVL